MKNLITSIACVMLLLTFIIQFSHNQTTHNRLMAVNQAVNNFREGIKQEGCVDNNLEKELKSEVVRITGCRENQITVDGDRKPVHRGNKIFYSVKMPIDNIVASEGFWGIHSEDNKFDYEISRYTTSEYIGAQT